jgi:heme A synthase
MLPSIATAVTYFLGRDIYAAVIVQNFMGIVGVLAGLSNLEIYRQPMVPIYALSAVSVAALVISLSATLKRTEKWIQNSSKQRVVSNKDKTTGENGAAL